MSRNITNCIQNTWNKSGNMVIFGTNIRTFFKYIYYLDIYMYIYIIKLIQTQKDSTQNPTHKFIIFSRGPISKEKRY